MAGLHSARSQTIAEVAQRCGELELIEPGSATGPAANLFELDHPLTENTQCVSVLFTSSCLLSTTIPLGVFSDPLVDQSATVGRVVRIIPTNSQRKSIPLPADVLLLIFDTLRSPYRGWRRDVLNAALVCREWTYALNVLLIDFRSQGSQYGHPPEIVSFANGLAARPGLGLDIKHLSAGYLERHPTWDPCPPILSANPSPMFLAKLRLQRHDARRMRFATAFVSILRIAKNIQSLSLDTANTLVISPDEIADALTGLDKLDTFSGKCPFSMAQLLSCIATWPSLKRLTVFGVLPPGTHPVSSPTLSCRLTELVLEGVSIRDDELACLVHGSMLERLTLIRISHLTSAGLGAALTAVSASLTHLCIQTGGVARDALDAAIADMRRLTHLAVSAEVGV